MSPEEAKALQPGTPLIKVSGRYHPPGDFRGTVETNASDVRVIVEHAYGMLHIYSPEQLSRLPADPAPTVTETPAEDTREPWERAEVGDEVLVARCGQRPEQWMRVKTTCRPGEVGGGRFPARLYVENAEVGGYYWCPNLDILDVRKPVRS